MQQFYDSHKTDLGHIDERLRLVVELVLEQHPAALLDAACGRGALLRHLKNVAPEIATTGSDISTDSVEYVRSNGINAAVANAEQEFPFADEQFDCVVFGEVLEHLVDPDKALLNISRVLRRGGALVLTTPNMASWFNRLLLLAGVQPIFTETSLHVNLGRKHPALGQWKPTQGHLKVFVKDALCEMLRANGFTVERMLGAPFVQPSPAAPLDRLFSRIPSLASNFVVLARNERTLETTYPRLPGWLN